MRRLPAAWRPVAALVVALVVLCPATSVRAQQVNITRYSTAHGLPAARVSALLQDRDGYLWFGTSGGLARYDGTAFQLLSAPGGLARRAVLALAEDPVRGLVVAMVDGGLALIHNGRLQRLPGDGLDGVSIRHLERDAQGTIWVATSGGAVRVDPGASAVELDATGAPGCCRIVLRDRRGRVWAGTDRGLARMQAGRLVAVDLGIPAGTEVGVLVEDTTGALWVGTRAGLYRETAGRFRRIVTPLGEDIAVLSAAHGPQGSLWFGTERGAIRHSGGIDRTITSADGLPDDRVNDLLVDREGTVWFATDGGAAKLVGSNFATLTASHGLPDDFVVAVLRDAAGRVWVATRSGLVWLRGAAAPAPVSLPGLGSASLTALGPGSGDDVLVGTSRGDLYRLDGGGQVQRTVRRAVDGAITSVLERNGELWLGTGSGLVVGDEERGFRMLREPAALAGAQITDLTVDRQGRLWIGTQGAGLFWRHAGGLEAVPGEPVSQVAVWDIAADPRAGVWVATNGLGVIRLGDGEAVSLTREGNGLASDLVQQVAPERGGRLWIYTVRGLDRWDPDIGVTHYDVGSGLADMSGNPAAATVADDGRAWLGTPSGLTLYRPGPEAAQDVRPRVAIREVRLDGRALSLDGTLTSRYDRNHELVLAYTALSYRDEAGTRFHYRLRGHSDQWSRLTDQRQVAYVGLPPGEYVFEVEAISAGGLWSESPASQAVVIDPAFWQTTWFQGGVGVLALLAVAALFRTRLRRVEDERQRLRGMVDKRTRELVEKNTLLERMATTDELTGLPNRRFFLESLQRELRKLSRLPTEQPLSLLVLDLDRFKSINDRFGHAAGDAVLRQVSRRLSQTVRATDLPARYGGEEFAILLPNTDREGARYLGEKLRADMEKLEVVYEGRSIPVTISVGLATVSAASRYDPGAEEELLRRADEAMYRAKSGGRNRVVLDTDPDPEHAASSEVF